MFFLIIKFVNKKNVKRKSKTRTEMTFEGYAGIKG